MTALGRHIIAELYNCNLDKINDVSFVETCMLGAADKSGATVINSTFHHFSPFGVSGVIVIQESHFSIHCWPEYEFASIDIYTCGDVVNPWVAYEYLKESFEASHGSSIELKRGQSNLISVPEYGRIKKTESNSRKHVKFSSSRNVWFTERNENIALSLKHSGDRLYSNSSEFQKIEIYQTEALGKILVLDGNIAIAEEDEYVYHEMIAHVPVFAHDNPKDVLVIGGGDGGTVRELVKHNQLRSIDLVEIDKFVIKVSKQFLPDLSSSLNHEKVTIHIEDGVHYVNKCKPEQYDIVIVDSDDPDGPSKGLFTEKFYKNVHRILKPNGIMITQSESPRYNKEVFEEVFKCYKNIYGKNNVFCYLMYLPSFPSGMWSFSFSSKAGAKPFQNLNKSKIDAFCKKNNLKYFSHEVHKSSFVLPKFVKEILQ